MHSAASRWQPIALTHCDYCCFAIVVLFLLPVAAGCCSLTTVTVMLLLLQVDVPALDGNILRVNVRDIVTPGFTKVLTLALLLSLPLIFLVLTHSHSHSHCALNAHTAPVCRHTGLHCMVL